MNHPKLTDRFVAVAFIALMLLVTILVLRIVQLQSYRPETHPLMPPLTLLEEVRVTFHDGSNSRSVSGTVVSLNTGWISIRQRVMNAEGATERIEIIPVSTITLISK